MVYNIKDFYIGELYLSYEFGNLLAQTTTPKERAERQVITNILINGAVDFQKGDINSYIDYKERRHYKGVLTIFLKQGNDMISLHNGVKYTSQGVNFFENVVPLEEVLPKFSYSAPEYLTPRQARILFNHLFRGSFFSRSMYEKTMYDINNFYMGRLCLYEGYKLNGEDQRYNYKNLIQRYIASNTGARFIGWFASGDEKEDEIGEPICMHDYIMLDSLFLKLSDTQVYNINDYQIYEVGVFDKCTYDIQRDHHSYYERMNPLSQIAQKNNIDVCDDVISMQKALKWQRIINRKNNS